MERNKDVYMNFVCPFCWNTLDNCTCELYPSYYLVLIDKNIQKHIRILNKKGYRTTACCEGHKEICLNTYIAFTTDYFKDMELPNGFKYNKKRKVIEYIYPRKLTESEMESIKKEKLEVLLKWCENLPNRSMEN